MTIAAAPWIDGVIFKKKYLHLVEVINQDDRIKVDVLEYHQGWIQSTAKIRVTVVDKGFYTPYEVNSRRVTLMSPISFLLEQRISHGPVAYDPLRKKFDVGQANIYSMMYLPEELSTTVLGNLKSEGVVEMSTLSQFNGDWVGKIRMPKLITTLPGYLNMVVDGLNGDYKFVIVRDNLRNLKINMHFGAILMDVSMENAIIKQVKVQPITYKNDTSRTPNGLWSGNADLTLPGITIAKADGNLITIGEINLSTTYGVSANTFYSTGLNLNIYDFKLNHPTIPNADLIHMKFSATNFNAEGLNEYVKFFKNSTSEALKNANLGTVESLLAHAVMKNSEIEAEIMAKTNDGEVLLRAHTTWKPNAPQPNSLDDIISNSETRIRVVASETITKKILQEYKNNLGDQNDANKPISQNFSADIQKTPQTPESIVEGLTKIGYITKEDEDYSTVFTFTDGELRINGRQLTR